MLELSTVKLQVMQAEKVRRNPLLQKKIKPAKLIAVSEVANFITWETANESMNDLLKTLLVI